MLKSDSTGHLFAALAKFQGEVENPKNTSVNPQFRSKYAALDVVINTVRPILSKHGLSIVQSTGSEGENVIVKTLLMHESGEWLESDPLTLPGYQLKGGGAKEWNAQGAGSAITYARRYSLSAILGISSEDDDDGSQQTYNAPAQQANSIKEKLGNKSPATVQQKPSQNADDVPASLKEKYQVFKGDLDGLEAYVTEQMMVKGKSYAQIEAALKAGIEKMMGAKS